MNKNESNILIKELQENLLAWITLHHFLSAGHIKCLCYAIVDKIGNGEIQLESLIADYDGSINSPLGSWIVTPVEKENDPLENQLLTYIRYLLLRTDHSYIAPSPDISYANPVNPIAIDKAIQLRLSGSQTDFNSFNEVANSADQPGFSALVSCLEHFICHVDQHKISVELYLEKTNNLPAPLRAAIIKHMGDRHADIDLWQHSHEFYRHAMNITQSIETPHWISFKDSISAIITQSIATTIRNIKGPAESAKFIHEELINTPIQSLPLLHSNISVDFIEAQSLSNEGFFLNRKLQALRLKPPLCLDTYKAPTPDLSLKKKKYWDIHREYGSLLSRQIALGSSVSSRITKSKWATSILSETDDSADDLSKEDFIFGIRLLIEAANIEGPSSIKWPSTAIEKYIDEMAIDEIIEHARSHEGSRPERELTAVLIFYKFSEAISSKKITIIQKLLTYISSFASNAKGSINTQHDHARPAISALKNFGSSRPELRKTVSSAVADVISKKLSQKQFWAIHSEVLELAKVFSESFSTAELEAVLTSIIGFLSKIEPDKEFWPVVRPALSFISECKIKEIGTINPTLVKDAASLIMRFGTQQESESASVLFYLKNFDPSLLEDDETINQLSRPLEKVKSRALKINSSDAVNNIMALLIAPTVSRVDGFNTAINGLKAILESASEKRPSISFPYGYQPYLYLSGNQERIAHDLGIDISQLKSILSELLPPLAGVWKVAKSKPTIFSDFLFQEPSQPNKIYVHNWAYASARFADSLGEHSLIDEAIADAANNPDLYDGIGLSKATRFSNGEVDELCTDDILSEDKEAFYLAMGRRLNALPNLSGALKTDLCKALLIQCLKLGPREIDAAVFLFANELKLTADQDIEVISNYRKRLQNDNKSRFIIGPIMDSVFPHSS